MKKKENTGIIVVPHKERPTNLEVEIIGIPQWKQDVFNLVAELTKYRLRNKITQQELANRLRVNQSVVARFEKLGRYPTIEFLYKVAEGLGIKIDISTNVLPATPVLKEHIAECFTTRKTGEPNVWNEYTANTIFTSIGKQDKFEIRLSSPNGNVYFNNKTYEETPKTNREDEFVSCGDSNVQLMADEQDSKVTDANVNLAA